MKSRTFYLLLVSGIVFMFSVSACTPLKEKFPEADKTIDIKENHYVGSIEIKPLRADFEQLIQQVLKKYQLEGLSIAIVERGKTIWAQGFGYADKENKIPADAATTYRVGSLAKLLTAVAIMQLNDSDELDIDLPLNRYIPEFSIQSRFAGDEVPTLRQVLCHHSGLPSDLIKGMWSNQPFSSLVPALTEEYLVAPPDTHFSYSNLGYSLLGDVVQRVSNLNFPLYMLENVFIPVNMQQSTFEIGKKASSNFAIGYKAGKPHQLLPVRDVPAYGLYSSVLDMAEFMKIFLGSKPHQKAINLTEATINNMMLPQNKNMELDLGKFNGIGWFVEKDTIPGAGYVVRHGGTMMYYASEMLLFPERDLGIVVLSNTAGSRQVISKLAEILLGEVYEFRDDIKPAPNGDMLASLLKIEVERIPTKGGRFMTELGAIDFMPSQKKICFCRIGRTFHLNEDESGWFNIQENNNVMSAEMEKVRNLSFYSGDIEGRHILIGLNEGQEILLGEQIHHQNLSQIWQNRVGTYEFINPDPEIMLDSAKLEIREGVLMLNYHQPLLTKKNISVPLRPVSETEAIIPGYGRMGGETLRFVNIDGVEHIRFSGYIGCKLP